MWFIEGLADGKVEVKVSPTSDRLQLLDPFGNLLPGPDALLIAFERERADLLVREQVARAEAEAAVRVRDDFLSVAAHELKTPVTSVRAISSLPL